MVLLLPKTSTNQYVYRYGVAEEAVGAIYALAKHPDNICSEILRKWTKAVFSPPAAEASPVDEAGDTPMADSAEEGENPSTGKPAAPAKTSHASQLSQLLFLVGHVAGMLPKP